MNVQNSCSSILSGSDSTSASSAVHFGPPHTWFGYGLTAARRAMYAWSSGGTGLCSDFNSTGSQILGIDAMMDAMGHSSDVHTFERR